MPTLRMPTRSCFAAIATLTLLHSMTSLVLGFPDTGFSTSIVDAASPNVGAHTSLKFDSQGQPHITYYQDTGIDMKYAHRVGSSWVIEVARNSGGIFTSLALAADDMPHVALYDPALNGLVYAFKDPTTWHFESVSGIRQAGDGQNSLVLDASGKAHIAYWDQFDDSLRYAVRTAPSTWVLEAITHYEFQPGPDPSLALTPQGEPRLAYGADLPFEQLRYASKIAGVWQTEVVVNGLTRWTSLALTAAGEPRIAYIHGTPGSLHFAYRVGGVWAIDTVDTNTPLFYCSLALTAAGEPRIAYSNGSDLKYAAKSGGTWTIETADEGRNAGLYCSLALDTNGNPYISHFDVEATGPQIGDLRLAKKIGGSWSAEIIDDVTEVRGSYTAIAVDQQMVPHISYYDAKNGDLRYVTRADNSYVYERAAGVSTDVGTHTSIAVTGQGVPLISYYDNTNHDLRLATRLGTNTWASEPVATSGDVGQYGSLVLASDGLTPHVSFFDASNGDLLYATKAGAVWIVTPVDTGGVVGLGTSIDLDESDNPHVSYYDQTNGDLKYATRTAGVWVTQTVTASGDVGAFSSIEVVNGEPAIAFYDATLGDLRIAESTSGSWEFGVVESEGDVGQHCSLERGAVDLEVAYYSATSGQLRHAKRVNGEWVPRLADDGLPITRDVGRYCSYAVDGSVDRLSWISYFDATYGYLKLAIGRTVVAVESPEAGLHGVGGVELKVGTVQRAGAVECSVVLAEDLVNLRVEMLDVNGRRVSRLWSGPARSGRLKLDVDGATHGRALGAGVYWITAYAGRERTTRRVVVLN